MKEYKKKKKAREAAVGFTNLVGGLKDVTSANAGRGGALGIFGVSKFSICSLGHKMLAEPLYINYESSQLMDGAKSGSLNQLSFRAGLQELGIKAAAADVNKLWDFMDSDHSGIITYPDFAAGLKVRCITDANGGL